MVQVRESSNSDFATSGNKCSKGAEYAVSELLHPERTLTMAVPIKGCLEPLSVKTSSPIPKDMMRAVVAAITNLKIAAPVYAGEVVLYDVCGLGVNVVATKTLMG